MKQILSVLLIVFTLGACQPDGPAKPAAELPFDIHPSVLRGAWSGTIFNIPQSKNSTLELRDIVAECADAEVATDTGTCTQYRFSGLIIIDGGSPLAVEGEGDVGDYIYTLTTYPPPNAPSVRGSFQVDDVLWDFYATYTDATLLLDGEPSFEGVIGFDDAGDNAGDIVAQSSAFVLEPDSP